MLHFKKKKNKKKNKKTCTFDKTSFNKQGMQLKTPDISRAHVTKINRLRTEGDLKTIFQFQAYC